MYPLRFHFTAVDSIHFPQGRIANLLRGGFGRILKHAACALDCESARECDRRATCAYALAFEPGAYPGEGPSGLRDWPRPFVFRTAHLDGATIAPGGGFHIGVNLFVTNSRMLDSFSQALAALRAEGVGPGRGKATLETVEGTEPFRLPLVRNGLTVSRLRVRFVTPTELKGAETPEFGVLFARIRDRISTLRALYGPGPLEIDFKAMGERAATVSTTRCDLEHVDRERVSRRTGQRHSLGGFVGEVEYEGNLGEFVPYLEIARWTGVGRQTVWGKGEIVCEAI